MHFFAQPSLGPDAEAVADQQHAHHELRIDRRPTRVAVKRCQVTAQITEIKKSIYATQQIIGRNVTVEIERVEQLIL